MDTKNAESRGQDTQLSAKSDWVRRTFNADPITENVLENLIDKQKKQDELSLNRNNRSVRDNADQNMEKAKSWIGARIKQITQDIEDLRKQLTNAEATPSPNAPPMLPVVNSEGIVITGDELVANPSKSSLSLLGVILLIHQSQVSRIQALPMSLTSTTRKPGATPPRKGPIHGQRFVDTGRRSLCLFPCC